MYIIFSRLLCSNTVAFYGYIFYVLYSSPSSVHLILFLIRVHNAHLSHLSLKSEMMCKHQLFREPALILKKEAAWVNRESWSRLRVWFCQASLACWTCFAVYSSAHLLCRSVVYMRNRRKEGKMRGKQTSEQKKVALKCATTSFFFPQTVDKLRRCTKSQCKMNQMNFINVYHPKLLLQNPRVKIWSQKWAQ